MHQMQRGVGVGSSGSSGRPMGHTKHLSFEQSVLTPGETSPPQGEREKEKEMEREKEREGKSEREKERQGEHKQLNA